MSPAALARLPTPTRSAERGASMAADGISRRVAVAGVGNSRFGNFPESDASGLAAEALANALDDAGFKPADVDGLVVNRVPHYARFGEMTGISPRWGAQFPAEGR